MLVLLCMYEYMADVLFVCLRAKLRIRLLCCRSEDTKLGKCPSFIQNPGHGGGAANSESGGSVNDVLW